MIRNVLKLTVLPFMAVLLTYHFSNITTDSKFDLQGYSTAELELDYTVPLADSLPSPINIDLPIPILGKTFQGFKEALAFKESQGDYFRVNQFGYLGKYQFGKSTLDLLGIRDTQNFLNSPLLQEKAFLANASRNKWVLRKDIVRYSGLTINGILITESGILAAAHLAGPGSVKIFLRSGGGGDFSDAYGTTIESYMRKFSNYDVSFIKPNKRAKAKIS